MPARIAIDRSRLEDFCRRHHIKKLSFFGSVLRDDFRQDSDVDVLYEFEEGFAPGWDIAEIEQELAAIVGRKVDLVPAKYLNRWIRDRVLAEAEVQYAR
jgi:predicted nucleotidyltransferase